MYSEFSHLPIKQDFVHQYFGFAPTICHELQTMVGRYIHTQICVVTSKVYGVYIGLQTLCGPVYLCRLGSIQPGIWILSEHTRSISKPVSLGRFVQGVRDRCSRVGSTRVLSRRGSRKHPQNAAGPWTCYAKLMFGFKTTCFPI